MGEGRGVGGLPWWARDVVWGTDVVGEGREPRRDIGGDGGEGGAAELRADAEAVDRRLCVCVRVRVCVCVRACVRVRARACMCVMRTYAAARLRQAAQSDGLPPPHRLKLPADPDGFGGGVGGLVTWRTYVYMIGGRGGRTGGGARNGLTSHVGGLVTWRTSGAASVLYCTSTGSSSPTKPSAKPPRFSSTCAAPPPPRQAQHELPKGHAASTIASCGRIKLPAL